MSGAWQPRRSQWNDKILQTASDLEWPQQTGWLPPWLLIACHFKKEDITSSPVGERGMRSDFAVCSVSRPFPVCLTHAVRWEQHTIYSLSSRGVHLCQGEMSEVWQMKRGPNVSFSWCPVRPRKHLLFCSQPPSSHFVVSFCVSEIPSVLI